MGHPDFRIRHKVFATLGYPDERHGMVKLSPNEQAAVIRKFPEAFRPAAGAWGRSGSTVVLLKAVRTADLRPVMSRAYQHVGERK